MYNCGTGNSSSHALSIQIILLKIREHLGMWSGQLRAQIWKTVESEGRKQRKREKLVVKKKEELGDF